MPWHLVWAACLGMFTATASGTTRAPFLLDMARDLETGLPMVANLVSLSSVAWGVTSLLAGNASDRWGRRAFLVGGPLALALALTGVATGNGFLAVAAWATLAGGCSGLFTGTIFAEVSARVPVGQTGRALGWIMSGQSLTLLIGVPLAAWVGAYIGWRGVNLCVAGLAAASALSLFATTSRRVAAAAAGGPRVSIRAALTPPVLRLLGLGIAERVCYGLTAIYYATFLQSTYGVSLRGIAMPLAIFALGNIVGTVVGGHLADRLRDRLRTFGFGMIGSAAAALALFGWTPGLATSVGLGAAYVFLNALARPSLMAALATVPEHLRGTVMGLNGTSNSIGWLAAGALGGWIMALYGFGGFGPLAAALAAGGAVLALARRR